MVTKFKVKIAENGESIEHGAKGRETEKRGRLGNKVIKIFF